MDEHFDLEARYVNGEIELTNSKLIDKQRCHLQTDYSTDCIFTFQKP